MNRYLKRTALNVRAKPNIGFIVGLVKISKSTLGTGIYKHKRTSSKRVNILNILLFKSAVVSDFSINF